MLAILKKGHTRTGQFRFSAEKQLPSWSMLHYRKQAVSRHLSS
jgi:hypothetical protein